MTPTILFRLPDLSYQAELEVAQRYFPVVQSRMKSPMNSLVIGRYACLPYYKELEEDLEYNGSHLINTYRMHRYAADLMSWYLDFVDITPRTWTQLHEIPDDGTKFVLKGETNSRKHDWKTHMFAGDKQAAGVVYSNLMRDSLIGSQSILIREYVPLRTLRTDITGLPITEEYRFFILKGKVVASGFYWSSHADVLDQYPDVTPDAVPKWFLRDICDRVVHKINAVVVDVARTQDGRWIVIELNDFQQAGLSECNPDDLYGNMRRVLDGTWIDCQSCQDDGYVEDGEGGVHVCPECTGRS